MIQEIALQITIGIAYGALSAFISISVIVSICVFLDWYEGRQLLQYWERERRRQNGKVD